MENAFSHTSGAWARGFVFLSQVLSVVCQLLFADVYF